MSTTTSDLKHPGDTEDRLGHARAHQVEPGRSFFQRLVATDARLAPFVARLSLGLVMLPHALQKTAGWFGGAGFDAAYSAFTKMGISGPLAVLAIAAELLGSIALILGALTRLGALAILSVMLGAIGIVHLPHGFFMNWSGTQAGEGFEYHLLAIALAFVGLLEGGGLVSVDRMLMKGRPAPGGSINPALSEQ